MRCQEQNTASALTAGSTLTSLKHGLSNISWKIHCFFCSMATAPTTSHKSYVLHESTGASYSACHLTLLMKHNPEVGVFAPLKVQWTNTCHEFYQKNPGSIVTKFNFSRLFSQAWCRVVTPANVIAGFRRAGLYPLNPNAISLTEDTSSDMCSTPSRYEVNSSDQDASHQTSPSSAVITTLSVDNTAVTGDSTPSCTATESSQCLPNVAAPSHSSTAGDISDRTSNTVFSAEQEEHFERRYEGGYDLPDPVYEEWLSYVTLHLFGPLHPLAPPLGKSYRSRTSLQRCHHSLQ